MGLRQDRLAEQIKNVIGGLFSGDRINDPRLQGVVITYVKITPDLQMASVYFRSYEESAVDDAVAGFESCSGFLKKSLAKELDVRRVPDLRFFYDKSIETGSRIEELLSKLNSD